MRKLERSLIRNPDFSQSSELPLFTKGLRFYPNLRNIIDMCKEIEWIVLFICAIVALSRSVKALQGCAKALLRCKWLLVRV